MRRLFSALALLLCAVSAGTGSDTAQIGAPVLGFFFDASSRQIRPIVGIPGAATLGTPIASDMEFRAVAASARADYVLAANADSRLLHFRARGPADPIEIAGVTVAADAILVSPGGAAAVVFDGARKAAQAITGLPEAYSQTLKAAGGTTPYTWSSTGALPPGITLTAASGLLSGTPTAAGTYNFSVQVTDKAQNTASKALSITVGGSLTITTGAPLPGGTVGVAYSQTVSASGGSAPYLWSVIGFLPSGMSLNASTGALTGTPTAVGTFNFTIQVRDGMQNTASKAFTLTIAGTLTISTTTLEDGMVGLSYSATLAAAGGTPPYMWSLASGSLPAGLTLNSSTGTIGGRPTAAGRAGFTVQAGDARSTATKALAINVAAAPSADFTGLSETANPAQQPGFGLTLASAAPMALTGQVTLTFMHNCVNGADDHAIQFANGRRTVDFTVAANSNDVMFGSAPNIQLASTGTTAGTITLTVNLQARGEDVTPSPAPARTIRVNQLPPSVASVSASRTGSGLEVRIIGYSTPRQMTQATFRFAAVGADLQTTELTVPLEAAFTKWYSDPASPAYGSQFLYVQPFTVVGDTTRITSVTVILTNAQGGSQAATASF